jgi:hypothetical protein
MKTNCLTIINIILFVLLQSPFVHAQNSYKSDFVKALSSSDFPKIEQIINNNAVHIPESEKRLMYAFALDYSRRETALAVLQILQENNILPSMFDLFNAINRNHSDEVIQFILDRGIMPNGEILLFAAEKNRFNLVHQFATLGADINYQYPPGSAYANGMTALLYAIREGNFETVVFLVEQGAQVNIADNNNYTPLSLSKELSFTEIYDFLIAHGANEVETQIIAEEDSRPRTETIPTDNAGQGIASLIDTKQITLQSGTYRLAGSTTEIIIPNSSMGAFSYMSQGISLMGGFRIDKGNMIIMMQGKNHTYTIDSDTSFSGYGERWVRVAN